MEMNEVLNRRATIISVTPYMMKALMAPDIVIQDDPDFPYMATDNDHIYMNRTGLDKMDMRFFSFVFIHEIAHILCGHVDMMREEWYKSINTDVMDYACENVANYMAKSFGLKVPESAVYEEQYDKYTEWEIYNLIMKDPDKKKQVEKMMGGNSPLGGSSGSGISGSDIKASHGKWGTGRPLSGEEKAAAKSKAAGILSDVANRMIAQGKGDLAANLLRKVAFLQDNTNWEFHLQKYLEYNVTPDYTYAKLDRRTDLSSGFPIPSLMLTEYQKNILRKALIFGDTSGSVTEPMIARMVGSNKKIFEDLGGYECYAGYCDAAVHNFGPLEQWESIEPSGHGGTDFRPIFDFIEKEFDNDIRVVIIYTDGEGTFPQHAPPYDVLWMDFGTSTQYPFGDVIKYKI